MQWRYKRRRRRRTPLRTNRRRAKNRQRGRGQRLALPVVTFFLSVFYCLLVFWNLPIPLLLPSLLRFHSSMYGGLTPSVPMKRPSASASLETTRPARKDGAGSDDSQAVPAGETTVRKHRTVKTVLIREVREVKVKGHNSTRRWRLGEKMKTQRQKENHLCFASEQFKLNDYVCPFMHGEVCTLKYWHQNLEKTKLLLYLIGLSLR